MRSTIATGIRSTVTGTMGARQFCRLQSPRTPRADRLPNHGNTIPSPIATGTTATATGTTGRHLRQPRPNKNEDTEPQFVTLPHRPHARGRLRRAAVSGRLFAAQSRAVVRDAEFERSRKRHRTGRALGSVAWRPSSNNRSKLHLRSSTRRPRRRPPPRATAFSPVSIRECGRKSTVARRGRRSHSTSLAAHSPFKQDRGSDWRRCWAWPRSAGCC